MRLIKNLFNNKKEPKEQKQLPWISLSHIEQLTTIKLNSKTKTQLIFKHSTRCGISRMVLNQFIDTYSFTEQHFDLYYLDLLNYRNLSDEVGYMFQVLHESPQLLIVKDEVVKAHASHGQINSIVLSDFLK
jgi:bacillithiol system protein YtxJ